MARIETSVEIAARPELIFAFFVPQRMPYWYGAEMEVCFEVLGGASEFVVGSKVRVSGRLAGRPVGHTAVVTAYRWGREFEWRFEDHYGVKGMERWDLEPLASAEAERARVSMLSDYTMPGRLGRTLDWLVTRHSVAHRNRDYLARLARLAAHGKPVKSS